MVVFIVFTIVCLLLPTFDVTPQFIFLAKCTFTSSHLLFPPRMSPDFLLFLLNFAEETFVLFNCFPFYFLSEFFWHFLFELLSS